MIIGEQYVRVLTHCLFNYGPLVDLDGLQIKLEVPEVDWYEVIAMVEDKIKNFCNIGKVPRELEFTWAQMATDYMNYWLAQSGLVSGLEGNILDGAGKEAKSIKMGDTTVELVDATNANERATANLVALASHKPNLDNFILDYQMELKVFRRLSWTKRR